MTHLFVKHIPKDHEGIVSYDLNAIRQEIPDGYKALSDHPRLAVTPSGVTVYFECTAVGTRTELQTGS